MNVDTIKDPAVNLRLVSIWSGEFGKWLNSFPILPSSFFKLNRRQQKKAIQKILSARMDSRIIVDANCTNIDLLLESPKKKSLRK